MIGPTCSHIEEIYCNLQHWITDVRDRERDDDYREMQESNMRRILDALDRGRCTEAARYNFLSPA